MLDNLELYDDLQGDVATVMRAAAERIREHGKKEYDAIIEIGKELIKVKDLLEHGEFLAWIDAEFAMSADTAQRYMRIARIFHDVSNTAMLRLSFSVLNILASPSCPDEVKRAVIEKAKKGKPPSVATIQKQIAALKQPKPKQEDEQHDTEEEQEPEEEQERTAVATEPAVAGDPDFAPGEWFIELDLNDLDDAAEQIVAALGSRAVKLAERITRLASKSDQTAALH